nr:MAG TPA: hypothetical protein [Caudoviricetes sp.]
MKQCTKRHLNHYVKIRNFAELAMNFRCYFRLGIK